MTTDDTPVPLDAPVVGVVVVAYRNEAHVDRLLHSLEREAATTALRVVLVDNGPEPAASPPDRPGVRVLAGHGNVGYAGGINLGVDALGEVDAVLVLNADLDLEPGAVAALLARLDRPQTGIVLPLLLDEEGALAHSLRREPTLVRQLGDAVLGRFFGDRPAWLSETVRDPTAYAWPHPVDWGTGAAVLIRAAALRAVGPWDERFFLYSEETDYCRRAREAGWEVWFEPAARVRHVAGGSGRSADLTALLQVNRVRYARKHRSALATAATLAVTALTSLARTWDAGHRTAVRALVVPSRRRALVPHPAGRHAAAPAPRRPRSLPAAPVDVRGTVIVPAHDEAAVLARTLAPLAPWAAGAGVEVVVVANGCTDATAEVARRFAGVTVLDLPTGSKTGALNAGDAVATAFPRVYLDADVRAEPAAVAATLRALADGPWLAARPPARIDLAGTSAPVRAFHRARARMEGPRAALWGAGVYGLSEAGHARLGRFPDVLADDLWVDRLFAPEEKTVVDAPPVRVAAPRTARALVRVLRRTYRGNAQLTGAEPGAGPDPHHGSGTAATLRALLHGVRGPRTARDAVVYAALVTAGRVRLPGRAPGAWERDESTRR